MFEGGAGSALGSRHATLFRVFLHFPGDRVIPLLSGYDKGDDPSERQRENADARRHLTAWRQQEARRAAEERKRHSRARRR